MKKSTTTCLLPLLLLAAGSAFAGPAATGSHQQLCQRIEQGVIAWANSDVPSLKRITAPGFVHSDERGRVQMRSEWLRYASLPRHVDIVMKHVAVRDLGDTAFVVGEDYISDHGKTVAAAEHMRFIQVWHRDGTGWREVAFQTTPVSDHAACGRLTTAQCSLQATVKMPRVDPPRFVAPAGINTVEPGCGFDAVALATTDGRG